VGTYGQTPFVHWFIPAEGRKTEFGSPGKSGRAIFAF